MSAMAGVALIILSKGHLQCFSRGTWRSKRWDEKVSATSKQKCFDISSNGFHSNSCHLLTVTESILYISQITNTGFYSKDVCEFSIFLLVVLVWEKESYSASSKAATEKKSLAVYCRVQIPQVIREGDSAESLESKIKTNLFSLPCCWQQHCELRQQEAVCGGLTGFCWASWRIVCTVWGFCVFIPFSPEAPSGWRPGTSDSVVTSLRRHQSRPVIG